MNAEEVSLDLGLWDQIANVMVSSTSTIYISVGIGLIAAYFIYRFTCRHLAVMKGLNDAIEAWKVPTPDTLDELAERYSKDSSLAWQSAFSEYAKQIKTNDKVEPVEFYAFKGPDYFFNEDTQYLSTVNLEAYRALPGILTGLGIFFTFVGLAFGIYLSIDGLTASAGLQNVDQIVEALKKLLGGASQAFWTSIAGLCSSLVLTVLINWLHNKAIAKLVEVDLRLREGVLIKTPEDVMEMQLATAEEEKSTINLLAEKWEGQMEQMFQTLMESYAEQNREQTDRMVTALDSIKEGISNMSQTQAELLGKTLTSAADVVGEKLGEKIDGMAASFDKSAQSVGAAVNGLDEVLAIVVRDVRTVSAELGDRIENLNTLVNESEEKLTNGMHAVADRMTGLLAEIHNATVGFENVTESATRAADELKAGGSEAAQSLKNGAESAGRILETEISKTVTEMNALLSTAEKLVKTSSVALESWQSKLEALALAQTRGYELLQTYDAVATKMLEASKKVEASTDILSTNMSEQASRTEHMNSTINERLSEVLDQSARVAAQQQTANDSIKQQQEMIDRHLTALAENLNAMNNQMRNNLAEADRGISMALNAVTGALDSWIERRQETDNQAKEQLDGIRREINRLESERRSLHEAVEKVVSRQAN